MLPELVLDPLHVEFARGLDLEFPLGQGHGSGAGEPGAEALLREPGLRQLEDSRPEVGSGELHERCVGVAAGCRELGGGNLSEVCGKVNRGSGGLGESPASERGFRVDPSPRARLALKAIFLAEPTMGLATRHDADVQAAKPEAEEQARFQGKDEHQSGPEDSQPQTSEGTAAAGREHRFQVRSMGEPHPRQGPAGRLKLPSSSRITRTREIRALFRTGDRKKTSHLDVFFLSTGLPRPRVGVVVPKYGQRAVDRNLVKRRVREVLRREVLPRLGEAEVKLDVLVRIRRGAYHTSYERLREELVGITEELCSAPSS